MVFGSPLRLEDGCVCGGGWYLSNNTCIRQLKYHTNKRIIWGIHECHLIYLPGWVENTGIHLLVNMAPGSQAQQFMGFTARKGLSTSIPHRREQLALLMVIAPPACLLTSEHQGQTGRKISTFPAASNQLGLCCWQGLFKDLLSTLLSVCWVGHRLTRQFAWRTVLFFSPLPLNPAVHDLFHSSDSHSCFTSVFNLLLSETFA